MNVNKNKSRPRQKRTHLGLLRVLEALSLEGDDDGISLDVNIDGGAVMTDAEGSIARADVVRVRHGEHLVLEGWPRFTASLEISVTASTILWRTTESGSCLSKCSNVRCVFSISWDPRWSQMVAR